MAKKQPTAEQPTLPTLAVPAPAPAPAPEPEPEEAEEAEATKPDLSVSKMEAVRRLLAEDPDIKPTDGVEVIKARFGLEISTGNFSAYKSQIKSKAAAAPAAKKKPGRPPAAAPAAAPAPGRSTVPPKAAGLADTLAALQRIVQEHGPEETKKLVDLFGSSNHG